MSTGPIRFPKTKQGYLGKSLNDSFSSAPPDVIRYSTTVKHLRASGTPEEHLEEYERDKQAAAHCSEHGPIDDPIIGLAGDRVAFACPWCSAPEMLRRWEEEGRKEHD